MLRRSQALGWRVVCWPCNYGFSEGILFTFLPGKSKGLPGLRVEEILNYVIVFSMTVENDIVNLYHLQQNLNPPVICTSRFLRLYSTPKRD